MSELHRSERKAKKRKSRANVTQKTFKILIGLSSGALLLFLVFLLATGRVQKGAAVPDDDNLFYIAPIVNDLTYGNLEDLKKRLGEGNNLVKIGFSASVFYMSETKGKKADFKFEPTELKRILNLAERTNLPVVIIFNGGPWGGSVERDPDRNLILQLERDPMNVQWRSDGTVPRDNEAPVPGMGRILTYNNLNKTVHRYKERNFRAAAKIIAEFYEEHPDLIIGITTDPEIFMSPFYDADYNPETVMEFREYEKIKFGGDLAAFNLSIGTSYASWDELNPPRPPAEPVAGNGRGEEWTSFKIALVDAEVQREVDWLREAGLPAGKIYTHQTIRTDNPYWSRYVLASPLETASVIGGSIGITTLQELSFDHKLLVKIKKWSPNWGIFEFNPSLPYHNPDKKGYNREDHYLQTLRGLHFAYDHGAHIISPYTWEREHREPHYRIRGTAYETAIKDFMQELGKDEE